MKKEVSPWYELSENERFDFISTWKKRWSWERDINSLIKETSKSSLHWEAPRIIGHRGTGKSHKNGSS